ncbi:MAG: ribosome silencing factor [Clostridia bacterium]|nr:ribosome silencing factor [Clostridia bacterium]
MEQITSLDLANEICKIIGEKQTSNILTIDVTQKTSLTNYYVVCTARNAQVAKGVCEHIQEVLEDMDIYVTRIDGEKDGKWIVMDYGLVIVHIFHTEMREFYKFEKLWAEPDNSNVKYYMGV